MWRLNAYYVSRFDSVLAKVMCAGLMSDVGVEHIRCFTIRKCFGKSHVCWSDVRCGGWTHTMFHDSKVSWRKSCVLVWCKMWRLHEHTLCFTIRQCFGESYLCWSDVRCGDWTHTMFHDSTVFWQKSYALVWCKKWGMNTQYVSRFDSVSAKTIRAGLM